ncbi:Peroxide stress-activated histidine kinase mak1 [Colletotrichum tanaceti]|uniref:Peroxide stress-activated histidine kinase mak1 n=1 Tax=Colletotrichum tanaceti TaxID=1306861 RepID=A0A4U6XDW2_9PEZI|nr:Peroxide stress-activated histidine kinase mak1 [Colletotrichum tanaceti]TKW53835.1 Peroxide stress-activated histidine kinase mak1 [Colletotrichum tanaceti]
MAMNDPPPAKVVSENRRERETFRYDPSLISQAIYNDANNLIPPSELRSSSDPALTAFAELGALRLNATRALISLFDSKYQYIVAEATPSLSLSPKSRHDDLGTGEHLSLSGTALPRSSGVCEIVLAVPDPTENDYPWNSPELPVTVIPDLLQDPRTAERSLCLHSPANRFYAGVPIRSQKGINIGVFCVFGASPREGLDVASTRLMQDMSMIIIDYLDAKRNRDDHRRADRMVRGVGSFMEGKSTMSGWRLRNEQTSFNDNPSFEGGLNKNQQRLQREEELVAAETSQKDEASSHDWQQPSPRSRENRNATDPLQRAGNQDLVPSVSGTSLKSAQHGSGGSPHGGRDPRDSQLRHVFSKASNIVREAIEVESVLFLDASIGSFGGLAENTKPFHVASKGAKSPSSSSDERSSNCSTTSLDDATCRVLGFSSSTISSIDGHLPSQSHASISEKFLSKLLRRYPEGKIFNFDEKGSVQSSDFSGDDHTLLVETPADDTDKPISNSLDDDPRRRRRQKNPFSRRNEGKLLNDIFSGARSIAIVPLWDAQKRRWHAGGFVCTKTPTRILTIEGELSYLRAFGAVIMSEIHRIDSAMVDKAKTDLLSSLSHELRSPLHGIILGAELLHDTPLDAFQGETLVSIENCGRTLLETIDHLLDWSKINNFMGPSQRRDSTAGAGHRGLRNQNQKISIEAGMMSITSNVNIDVLAEEVVESICAGFSYQRVSIAQLASNRPGEHADSSAIRRLDSMQAMEDMASGTNRFGDMQLVLGEVSVTFDINPATSWGFHTQPGAVRRIIMNLLGNSLKYTSKGFVNVHVTQLTKQEEDPSGNAKIQIDVVDSGRGISEDYLRHHLFSPFAQEDNLSAGAGLGLSLVNQIVGKLRGSIQVWSKVGHGTKVSVQLPLQAALPESPAIGHSETLGFNDFQASVSELGGLRVKLLGFPEDYGVRRADDLASNTPSEGESVASICREWLRMHIIDQSVEDQLLPDLVLSTERHLDRLLSERLQGIISMPVVVICRNALIARQLATSPRFNGRRVIFEFISQPIGPRKLAKVLLLSFRRWTRTQANAIPTPTQLSLTSAGRSNTNGNTPTGRGSVGGSTEALPEFPDEDELKVDKKEDGCETHISGTNGDSRGRDAEESNGLSATEDIVLPDRPKQAEQGAARDVKRSGRSKKDGKNRPRFLLVDDNPLNLKILASYMSKLGHEFHNAMDGEQALKVFQERPGQFQCVLMDISMPVMDGFEATRRIRAIEAKNNLPPCQIFALTGLASASAQQEAFASGIDLFLTKPVRLKELTRILETRGFA